MKITSNLMAVNSAGFTKQWDYLILLGVVDCAGIMITKQEKQEDCFVIAATAI